MITWLQAKSVPLQFPKVASRALQTLWLQRKFLTLIKGWNTVKCYISRICALTKLCYRDMNTPTVFI